MNTGPKRKVWAERGNKALGYIVIVSWDMWHSLKTNLALYVIPFFLFIVAGLELVGAVSHLITWMPHTQWIPQARLDQLVNLVPERVRSIIAVLLFSAVLFMVWHHRRISHDTRRHLAVIVMVRNLCAEMLKNGEEEAHNSLDQYIRNVLRALVITLEGWTHRSGWLNATLVVSRSGESFNIFDQYPVGTFPDGVTLDPRHSAAAAAALEKDTMVYIPYTRFVHGMRIAVKERADGSQYTKTDFVDNAFQAVQGVENYPMNKLKALVCVEVPNEMSPHRRLAERTRIDQGSSIVLCLGCKKGGKIGELDFVTIQLAAKLLATALKEKY